MRVTRFLGVSLLILVSVSCVHSPDEARSELGRLDWQYDSQEGFVEAAGFGDEKAVRLFILSGIDVDAPGELSHYTALMSAIRNNRLKVARLLLKHGADPLFQTEDDTILTHALASRSSEMIEFAQEVSGMKLPSPPTVTIMLPQNVPLQLVYIPPGTLDVNSEKTERWMTEEPISVERGFYIGKYEVTQAQSRALIGFDRSRTKNRHHPVEQVTWHSVQAFILELNHEMGGERFRLPTAVEWEYACRAGSTTRYHWGDDPQRLLIYAWVGTRGTRPVGLKLPNAFGLFDMTGNVREWCQDEIVNVRPPSRWVRGGCYGGGENLCRSGFKQLELESTRDPSIGFRIVMEAL